MIHIPGINQPLMEIDGEIPRPAKVRSVLMRNAKMGFSMRYRRLDRMDAFANCMEYDHLKHDWNGFPADAAETISPNSALPPGYVQPMLQSAEEEIPLARRRPSAPLRLTPTIIDRFTGMLFSEDRKPKIRVEGDLEADDFLNAALEDASFWTTIRQARAHGGAMGTGLLTFNLKDGRYVFRAHNPKYVADVVWVDKDRLVPAGVLIQYLTLKEFEHIDDNGLPTGRVQHETYVYRRIIDEQWDVVFKETLMDKDGRPPAVMEIDLDQSFEHKLGRFPGVWIQNLPNGDDIDGIADCDGAFQMMEDLDRLRAQSIRCLKYNMDPTMWTSRDLAASKGQAPIHEKGSGVAIELGAGGSCGYLEITGQSIGAASEKEEALQKGIFTKTQCVIPDPESPAAQASSGKALELAYQPMIEKCGVLRQQWGSAIKQLGDLILHAARTWTDKTKYKGNVKPVFKIPPKVEEKDPAPDDPNIKPKVELTARTPGDSGVVGVKWGAYFSATPADRQMEVSTVSAAKMGKLLDEETSIRLVCEALSLPDYEAILRKVKEEANKAQEQEMGMPGVGDEEAGLLEDEDMLEEEGIAAEPPPNAPSGQPGGFQ